MYRLTCLCDLCKNDIQVLADGRAFGVAIRNDGSPGQRHYAMGAIETALPAPYGKHLCLECLRALAEMLKDYPIPASAYQK